MSKLPLYKSFLKENRTRAQAEEIFLQRIKDSIEVFNKFSNNFYKRACPICGEHQFDELEKFHDTYGIAKCTKCSSIYVNPAPSNDALDYYYNNCYCNKQLGKLLKTRVGKEGLILNDRIKSVLVIIFTILKKKNKVRILEVGCNSGAFLFELSEFLKEENILDKVQLIGIDIDRYAIENPVSNELNLHHSSAEEFVGKNQSKFDLIMHFELIEHLNDPFEFCSSVFDLLDEKGLMYFHTPNVLGFDNQALSYNDFRPLAHGIFPPMHLNAFTTQNITHFLIRLGFKVREINTPGNFDTDIVREFSSNENEFSLVKNIDSTKSLAIFQHLISILGASSHMTVLAEK